MASVVGIAGWVLVIEAVLGIVAGPGLQRWLPGGAANALVGNGELPMWGAAVVLAAWVTSVAAVTVPVVMTRDVD